MNYNLLDRADCVRYFNLLCRTHKQHRFIGISFKGVCRFVIWYGWYRLKKTDFTTCSTLIMISIRINPCLIFATTQNYTINSINKARHVFIWLETHAVYFFYGFATSDKHKNCAKIFSHAIHWHECSHHERSTLHFAYSGHMWLDCITTCFRKGLFHFFNYSALFWPYKLFYFNRNRTRFCWINSNRFRRQVWSFSIQEHCEFLAKVETISFFPEILN